MKSIIGFICILVFINYAVCLQCGANEEKSVSCERSCETALLRDRICTETSFQPKCLCKLGFARVNGACVPSSRCPENTAFQCSPGETFSKCGPSCDRACGQPEKSCSRTCSPPVHACICIAGYGRKANGDCVKIDKC